MVKGLISVIVPTYEHAGALPACLDSILNQTYGCLEIIVVDDGSTDRTQDVLEEYRDRVLVLRQANAGANAARNRGRQEAEGEFFLFVDADSVLHPDCLEKMFEKLRLHPEASFAYSAFRFGWKKFRGIPFSVERLKKRNYIHTTSLVRAEDFPGFDASIRRLQDWDVWLTMVQAGKRGILIPETLFRIRIFGASRIGSSWLPRIFYHLPWKRLGWTPNAILRYERAREIILKKHAL